MKFNPITKKAVHSQWIFVFPIIFITLDNTTIIAKNLQQVQGLALTFRQ